MRSAICVGSRRLARLSLSVTTRPAIALGLGPVGDLFGQPPDVAVEDVGIGGVLVEGRLVRDADARVRWPRRGGDPRRARGARAGRPSAEARVEVAPVPAQEIGEGADARGASAACPTADAPDQADRAVAQEVRVSAFPITEKPRGLSRSEATLARNLLCDSPTEPVMPSSVSIRRAGGRASRRAGAVQAPVPVRSRNASSSDSGSMRGQVLHHRADLPRDLGVAVHARRTTTASGQSFSAWNIGMAERTPLMRAM
jgi:hypothetical protein